MAFYTWHVPVFFFLSGYLWSGRRTFTGEVRQRLESLGKPYLFWLVVLAALTAVVLPATYEDPSQRLLGALYGGAAAVQPFTTLWFVSVLLVSVLLYKAISPLPLWVQWMVVMLGLTAGTLWGTELSATPLSDGSAIPCVTYLVAGKTARVIRPSVSKPLLVGLILLAGSAALVISGASAPIDIKFGNYGTPGVSFAVACAISFGLVLVMDVAFEHAPGWLSQSVTKFALAGFTVVLLHPVFLWSPTPQAGDFLSGVLVPLAIGLIALKTPLSQWVTS
ncbi:acyltransferase family protein [Micrococcus terreus]|uniref:acyltransferase family protein n=1 Tax=Micrococcus terreus TaxID=574650 RepID=UPI0029532E11|nr:acyltransferase family protein [Micrococcus terreus]WOO96347.1 acyltransferase family protein [Micrococcus terreus]